MPQKRLRSQAASGYSSYGNQIGLATGFVKEDLSSELCGKTYGDRCGYGCCSEKRCHPVLTSDPGDIIILLGGRTGRDGCGGATGSSKAHTESFYRYLRC
ncbi:MAG: hypothetical protein ACLTDV_13515 [Eubacterium sp.]